MTMQDRVAEAILRKRNDRDRAGLIRAAACKLLARMHELALQRGAACRTLSPIARKAISLAVHEASRPPKNDAMVTAFRLLLGTVRALCLIPECGVATVCDMFVAAEAMPRVAELASIVDANDTWSYGIRILMVNVCDRDPVVLWRAGILNHIVDLLRNVDKRYWMLEVVTGLAHVSGYSKKLCAAGVPKLVALQCRATSPKSATDRIAIAAAYKAAGAMAIADKIDNGDVYGGSMDILAELVDVAAISAAIQSVRGDADVLHMMAVGIQDLLVSVPAFAAKTNVQSLRSRLFDGVIACLCDGGMDPAAEQLAILVSFIATCHDVTSAELETYVTMARVWLAAPRQGVSENWEMIVEMLQDVTNAIASHGSQLCGLSYVVTPLVPIYARADAADPCKCAACGRARRSGWKNNAKIVMYKCARCENIYYCSRTCQKSHWQTHAASCVPKTSLRSP